MLDKVIDKDIHMTHGSVSTIDKDYRRRYMSIPCNDSSNDSADDFFHNHNAALSKISKLSKMEAFCSGSILLSDAPSRSFHIGMVSSNAITTIGNNFVR